MMLINGQQSDLVSARDRALHYGDGLFETIAIKNGAALALKQHLKRLLQGCESLNLPAPDERRLREESLQVARGKEKAVLKWIISRGEGGRGYQPPEREHATRIVASYAWPDFPPALGQTGVHVNICQQRLGHQPWLAGIKHLNRLEQVLLGAEIKNARAREGIVLDISGNVIEGAMSNLFFIKENTLFTPRLALCGIAGIVRAAILERAAGWHLPTEILDLSVDSLLQADEVFFCNSIIGIWPVNSIGDQTFPVGPHTRAIRAHLLEEQLISA